MREILVRRCESLEHDDYLFSGISINHLWSMAMRVGAPRFMLHDLRKMHATVGERLAVGDAALRRILNHTAPKSDVLHKHYVSLNVADIAEPLRLIQVSLIQMMGASDNTSSS
jgi:integrase